MPVKTLRDIYEKSRSIHAPGTVLGDQSFEDWKKSYITNQPRYTDDDYLSEIEKYKNESWYQNLLTNPWLAGNQAEFSPTLWQQIASAFGDDSAAARYYGELRSNRSQWLSEFVERMRQQEYDSPSAQVAREKAAGLNPDLAPGSISPGAAAENDQPLQSVSMPSDSVVQEVGSLGMQFVSQIIGMAQSFQSLKAGNLDLVQREISNNTSARDYVLDQIAGSSFFNSENDLDNMKPGDLANNILAAAGRIDYSTYSPSTRKLLKSMFGRYSKDVSSGRSPMAVEALKSELRKRIVSNNTEAARGAASPLFDEDFNEFLRNIAGVFGDAEQKAHLASLKASVAESDARSAKASFDSRYYHNLSPEDKAAGENAASQSQSVTESQTAIIEGMWKDVYDICNKSKSWYGTLGLILIPFLRGILSNVSVSAGRLKNGKFGLTSIGN